MERKEDYVEEKGMKETLLVHSSRALGGVTTLPFILANEGFERAAYLGLQANMIVYIMGAYDLEMATGSNIILIWSAATNFTPIVGAFLADAYVGRFQMIGLGSLATLLGMILLWSTTTIPGVKPSYVATMNSTSVTLVQLIIFCSSLAIMAIGAGGIRSSTLAFGADQLGSNRDDDNENAKQNFSRALDSYFNWYYFALEFAMLLAFTCIVYIQDHMGWQVGFGVPVSLMLLSVVSFYLASSFYVKKKPKASLLTSFAQVLVASWRNRHYKLFTNQPSTERSVFHTAKGSLLEAPTDRLRFLNKACVVKDQTQDLTPDGVAINPWILCTIDQVEEFKAVIKVIPIWSTGIILGVTLAQSSPVVLQAKSMDRRIFNSGFEIPPSSFGTFALITVIFWLVLYDRVLVPLASKVMGKPVRLSAKFRMGAGLLFSFLSMLLSGVVEHVRLSLVTREGSHNEDGATTMSALWLVPQVCIIGLADNFTAVAQIEYFYMEFPKSMSSIASNIYGLSMTIASLVASLVLTIVDTATKDGGRDSWVSSDPNNGHYDYYYWVLAGFSLLNYLYFLLCSRGYVEKISYHKETSDE